MRVCDWGGDGGGGSGGSGQREKLGGVVEVVGIVRNRKIGKREGGHRIVGAMGGATVLVKKVPVSLGGSQTAHTTTTTTTTTTRPNPLTKQTG